MQIARECIVELTERDLLPDTVDLRTNHCGLRGMGFGTRNRRWPWWSWWGGFQIGQERSPWHQQRECGEKNSSVHTGFWVFPSETPWSLEVGHCRLNPRCTNGVALYLNRRLRS
jgi:hypothetical protein